ncbi:Protein involved in initiation of plasmid replication [Moraxella lacunata]|uniref:Protein involved in initiation of plasmid replication n=1 Tax=Moraxella lacunata TaxID=477 RepID=A0A378UEZ6_MORLA|nr:replication initiation protein [Moraxella lacunata]STZ74952.1 Protein involved in initiation of plasmid replication [Moraxella lacunata]
MDKQDKKPLTRTPQELVHIKHSISARQYKYWFLLLKAYKELIEASTQADKDGFYSVSLSDISNLMGYEPVKKELKADLEALRQQPIIINYLEKDGKPVTHGMGFLSEWKVSSTKISFKLPSFIEKVVQGDLEAKQMFLLLNWDIFNSFGGKYEAIIYKLCKDYIGVGRTPYFTVAEYRDYIGLKENEYKQFFELNRWAISKPIKNINDNEMSDILVKVVLEKKGVKVIGLHFEMEYKATTPVLEIAPLEPNPSFEKSLITIPPNKQLEYLGQFSEDQIKAIIDRANDYIDKLKADGKKASVGAIYNKAFAESWGLDNWEAEQKAKAEEEERKHQAKAKREAEVKAQREAEEREKQERAERERCFAVFEALPQDEQEAILDEIEQTIKQTIPFFLTGFKEDRKNGLKPYKKPPHCFTLVGIIHSKNL